MRLPPRAGCPDVCLSTQEERLEHSAVRRSMDLPRLLRILTLELAENLAAGTGQYTVTDGINAWTDEAKDYNPQNPAYSHFTQVVWKGTRELGCAIVTCPAGSIFPTTYGVRTPPYSFIRDLTRGCRTELSVPCVRVLPARQLYR